METVTRFIGKKRWFDINKKTVSSAIYYNDKNIKDGEISVFDIDKELQAGEEDKIFEIGDKRVFRNPPNTVARADLKVIDVEQIPTSKGNLKVVKKLFQGKHCNIKPFPNDASALNAAGQLVKISELHIKQQ